MLNLWMSFPLLVCLLAVFGVPVAAQTDARAANGPELHGPEPPVAPAVVARDQEGRVTIRANRLPGPIVLDGRLDERMYADVPAISDFIQQEPQDGAPATEKTEVWVFFDERNVYFSARCWDSQPERQVANEMKRDGLQLTDNEMFSVALDTFYDRRNGYMLWVNLLGGIFDAYVTDERDFNRDWNGVWEVKTARSDTSWTVEMSVPFKSIRYKAAETQVWGVNFRRFVRWKNEASYLSRVPAAMGRRGLNKLSSAGTLVGIEPPPSRRNFELKPYAIGDLTTDRTASPQVSNKLGKEFGVDAKVGLTDGLTADITYNTDFAQVEVDEQQVNLTRFNVFFPEKRDFFLEGQGIFGFGGVRNNPRNGIGPGGNNFPNPDPIDAPNLFFSRRIGLTAGHKVPIDFGARVSGKAGPYSVGLLEMQTGAEPRFGLRSTNFGVVRVKRDILGRSAVGVLMTNRSLASSGVGSSQLVGVDGVFSFFQNLYVNTYLAKSRVEGKEGDDISYRAQVDYTGDRYGFQIERLFLDDNFEPDVGFLRRRAFRRDSAFARFSPRPKSVRGVRRFIWDTTFDYITDPRGRQQSRYAEGAFRVELSSGDAAAIELAHNYDVLEEPFRAAENVSIPTGAYTFPEFRAIYWVGPQRSATGIVKFVRASYYTGTRTEIGVSRGRVSFTKTIAVEPGLSQNWIDTPQGSFSNTLITARTTWTPTPQMMLAALIQRTSINHAIDTNVRFQWEYQPGSYFYMVYTDGRTTRQAGFPELLSRGFVVKFTRLFRL